jgi:hypothetical protein
MHMAASLTPNDFFDFHANPGVFCGWAYDTARHAGGNPRNWGFQFVKANPEASEFLLQAPITESALFLLAALKLLEVREFLVACIGQQLPPEAVATLLFALSKMAWDLVPDVVSEFAFAALRSGIPVIVTQAYRLIRKLIRAGVEIDSNLAGPILSEVDLCVTSEASRLISELVRCDGAAFGPFVESIIDRMLRTVDCFEIAFHLESLTAVIANCPELQTEELIDRLFPLLVGCDLSQIADAVVAFFLAMLGPGRPTAGCWSQRIITALQPAAFIDFADVLAFIFFYHSGAIELAILQGAIDGLAKILHGNEISTEERAMLSSVLAIALFRVGLVIDLVPMASFVEAVVLAPILSALILSGQWLPPTELWAATIKNCELTRVGAVLVRGACSRFGAGFGPGSVSSHWRVGWDYVADSRHSIHLAEALSRELGVEG